jgi:phage tail P2-like protein
MSSPSGLLPSSRTTLERAVTDAGSLRDLDPDIIRTLWNADTCPPEFLPYLAWSLSVDFWELAQTDDERRDLILGAIQWHRKRGTPWAIKQALAAFGYPVLELIEQMDYHAQWVAAGGHVLDGSWMLDGTVVLSTPETASNGQIMRRTALNHWAQYAIRLNATSGIWTREHQRKIRALAEAFAPGRSELVSLIAGLNLAFEARITLKALAARLRIRLSKCRRFQPAARRTLDGCWKLDGGEVPLLLDGSWTLDGRRLDGRTLTGVPLDNGHIDTRQKLKIRLSMTMAGLRREPPKPLGNVWMPLDGSWTLGEMALQGWPMDKGLSLASAQLDRLALPRLDGTWLLGGELGGPRLWFSGVVRIRQNGITTQEPL